MLRSSEAKPIRVAIRTRRRAAPRPWARLHSRSPVARYNSQASSTGDRCLRIFPVLWLRVLLGVAQLGMRDHTQSTRLESLLAEAQKAQAGSDYAAAAGE